MMKSEKLPTTVLDVSFDPSELSQKEVDQLKADRGKILIFPEGISDDLHRVIASHNAILSSFSGVMRKKYFDALEGVDENIPSKTPVYREDDVPLVLARTMHRLFNSLPENDQHNFLSLLNASCEISDQL